MSSNIDWGKLVTQGRAKAIGVPWNEKELAALAAGVRADDVRAGILSKDQVEKADEEDSAAGEKRLERMSKDELIEKAQGLGIEFDPSAVTKADLILEIKKKQEASSEDETESDDDSESEEESEENV